MRRLTRLWLQEREPELADRLERCWDLAFNEWLPAIGINKGSFNSFPHLRNLEMYLDEILFAPHPEVSGKRVLEALELTPSEVYAMLCSILFHDLGRSYSYEGMHSHACESRITLASSYRELGLESEEFALCVGRICHFHDPEEDKDREAEIIRKSDGGHELAFPPELRDVTITGYGVIREKLLGALLVLVDHMDGTFSRVLPHYVRTDKFESIGKFRSRIPGIRVDLSARMVITAVKKARIVREKKREIAAGEPPAPAGAGSTLPAGSSAQAANQTEAGPPHSTDAQRLTNDCNELSLTFNQSAQDLTTVHIDRKWQVDFRNGSRDMHYALSHIVSSQVSSAQAMVSELAVAVSQEVPGNSEIGKIGNELLDVSKRLLKEVRIFCCWDALCMCREMAGRWHERQMKRISPNGDHLGVFDLVPLCQDNNGWGLESTLVARQLAFLDSERASPEEQERMLLATIAGNTLENARALKGVGDLLRTYGIPLYAWLLECDEHLYTCFGAETFEPRLSKDFLKRLAQAMWNKSTRVFGRRISTYEGVASDMREERVERVRVGVRRLAIITRGMGNEGKNAADGIQALQDGWYWGKTGPVLKEVIEGFIERLVKPSVHLEMIYEIGEQNDK